MRSKFSAGFKAKVAIEAIKEQQTVHELAAKYEVHATQINAWKRDFLNNAESAFSKDQDRSKDDSQEKKELYSKIGELQIQVDFLNYIDAGMRAW
ncbi:transposase [Parapedobacter soli]|uniref:transposase n=1 Tax=Parapedobacter soli TaxID=416955 RepID=UPI0036F23311